MTFAQLVVVVGDYCNLSSTEATTRIGKSVNRHYRRITSELGLDATRFVTRSVAMTVGVRSVTFTDIEKIDRILDTTDATAIRLLTEVSQHTQRTTQPSEGAPNTWSLQNTDADAVVVLTDTVPQSAYSLQADGRITLADLSGSDEPVFPESYHDILSWYVIAEELLKKEKDKLARIYESKADKLLSELRFFLADSPTLSVRARNTPASSLLGGGGGGGTTGGTAYTQTSLLTFDLGAGVAPFAVAQATALVVTNLDADKLDGQHGSYYLDLANHSGTLTLSGGQIVFPASQNASSNANTLDDYEEGTFTPVLGGTGGQSGQAYTSQYGHYIKIGKLVHFDMRLTMSTLGTVTTQAVIGTLPFTPDATSGYSASVSVGYWEAFTSTMCFVSGIIQPGEAFVRLFGITAGATGLSNVGQADLSNTSTILLSGSYKAAA